MLCESRPSGIETTAIQYCAILAISRIAIVTIIIVITLLFSFQELQQSDLEHSAFRHLTFDI